MIDWKIDWLQTSTMQIDGHDEVVLTAGWRCNGVQDTFSGSVYSTCSFPAPTGAFTPYAQLTQAEVLGWCYANGVNKDATEAAVQSQLDNQINPPTIQPPLPWTDTLTDFTPEQMVAKSYSAAMDSVNLINAGKPASMAEADWADMLQRNKDHLAIQAAKTEFYAGFDMTAIAAAAA